MGAPVPVVIAILDDGIDNKLEVFLGKRDSGSNNSECEFCGSAGLENFDYEAVEEKEVSDDELSYAVGAENSRSGLTVTGLAVTVVLPVLSARSVRWSC